MWRVLSGLASLGLMRSAHPLADVASLKRFIDGLPGDDDGKSLTLITACLESWVLDEQQPLDCVVDGLRRLDRAAASRVLELAREYQHALRPARRQEACLWTQVHGYWAAMAATCELLLHGLRQQQAANPEALSWVCGRLIGALAHLFKWQQLHYGPIAPELWLRAGQALMLAEQHDVGEAAGRADEARQEYARLMALQAASLNSLTPAQMDTAEMLIDHFVDGFALSSQPVAGAVYWIDPAGAMPAQRVSQAAELPLGRVRYMLPGQAHSAMADLLTQLDAGQAVPQELKRRGALAHTIRAVLPHLLDQFSALPLPRAHVRRAVRQRMAVLHGLPAAWQAFAWRKAGMAGGQSGESWVVEDASAGGFRASLIWHGADWLKIGALLSLCPEGGDNWLLGCIRRCQRDPDGSAYIGIEVLGRQVQAVDFRLRPVVAGSYARAEVVPGLLILDAQDDDACRVILPAGAFALKESLGCLLGDVNYVLTPVCLLEQGGGFALACYSSPELRSRSMGGS